MNKDEALDLLLLEPEAGSVILLRVSFDNPKTYTYAAVEISGLWYLTGADGKNGRTWGELIVWLKNKGANVDSIQRATEWENL